MPCVALPMTPTIPASLTCLKSGVCWNFEMSMMPFVPGSAMVAPSLCKREEDRSPATTMMWQLPHSMQLALQAIRVRSRRSLQQPEDLLPGLFRIVEDVLRREARNPPAQLLHGLRAPGIVIAVDLDHQLLGRANEGRKVRPDRLHAPEARAAQRPGAQQLPHGLLGMIAATPQAACPLDALLQSPPALPFPALDG